MKKNACKKCLSIVIFYVILTIFAAGNAFAGSWEKDTNGWWYDIGDGTYPADSWYLIDGEWYCFDGDGYMRTGFVESNGVTYYCKSSGAMATGWREIDGNWYYFSDSGEMNRNQWIGDYYVLVNGKMAINQEINGYWVGSDGKYIPKKEKTETHYNEENEYVNNWYDYGVETEFVYAQPEESTLKITKHVPITGEYDVGTTVPITGVIESNYPIRIVQV